MHILVLEASTSATKAMLYDTSANAYRIQTDRYPDNFTVQQQDAEQTYKAICATARKLIDEQIKIDLIVLIATWHSLLLCDFEMHARSPVYLWAHLGAAEISQQLHDQSDWSQKFYQKTGCQINASYPFFKLLWCKQQGISLEDTYISDQGVYLAYRLTGIYATTHCMASGTGLMNIRTLSYDPDLLHQIGISNQQLPPVYSSDTVFALGVEGAKDLHLPQGIPVMLANADGGMNQVGSGALGKGIMTLSVGTSGALRLSVFEAFTENNYGLWCYRSPKGWLAGAATSGACNCIDWIKGQFFPREISYEEMEGNRLFKDRPLFLPFLFGERAPGWNAERRGGFIQLHAAHTAQACYQAVQEGILFNLYQCYQTLCKVYDVPERIYLSGGIQHSARWLQMCADIFGRSMEVEQNTHGSLMGGVVLGMEKLGIIADAAQFPLPIRYEIKPDAKRNAYYQKQYEKYQYFYSIL